MVQPSSKRLVTEANLPGYITATGATKTALAGTFVAQADLDTNGTAARASIERMFQQVETQRLQRFSKTATSAWTDGGGWAVERLDLDRNRLIGTKNDTTNGVSIGYSDDGGATWVNVKTLTPTTTGNTENLLAEMVTQLANGELLVGTSGPNSYWGQIWKSSGWSANPVTATWTRVYRAPFSQLGTKVSGDYHGIAYDGATTLMAAWYDKKTNNAAGVTANAGVYVRKSVDSGVTWTDVFRLDTFLTGQGVDPLAAGYHVHSVAYDRFWDAWWVSFGDTDGTTGRCGYLYSLDGGTTWQIAYFGTGSNQSVSVYAMLDCVLFLGDGGSSSGVNRLARNPAVRGSLGAITKGYTISSSNAIGERGSVNLIPGGWVVLPFTQISGTTRVSRIVATADGTNFYDLYADPTYTVTGVSGLRRVVGPTASGKIIGTSFGDGRFASGTSIVTLTPTIG